MRYPAKKLLSALATGTLIWTVTATAVQASAVTDTGSHELSRRAIIHESGVRAPAQYPALVTQGKRNNQPVPKARTTSALNSDFWVYSADLSLSADLDYDGHYSSFEVSIDVDTSFTSSPVYAILYLSYEGGPWNEYAVTSDFYVSGTGPYDNHSISVDLDSGYPSGYYDHYIEVYDSYTHQLVGDYGPYNSSYHSHLPFEGFYLDDYQYGANVSLSFSGTGAMGPWSIPALLMVAFASRIKRRRTKEKTPRKQNHSETV